MKTWLTLFLLSILFTGCNSGIQTNSNDSATTEEETLIKGTSSVETEDNYIVLNSGQYPISTDGDKETTIYHSNVAEDVLAFEEAYRYLTNETAPSFEGTIVIATMGEQTTGGYAIEVESVQDVGRFTQVTLLSTEPSGLATMALTNPFIIVSLSNDNKDVTIIDK